MCSTNARHRVKGEGMPTRRRRSTAASETAATPRPRAPDAPTALALHPVTPAWSLDVAGQRLVGGGRMHFLSALQFRLLRHLVQRPEVVLTRRQLLDAVWGEDFVGSERVVDQAVCELRRLLEPDPARPRALRTQRGVGYLFVPPQRRRAPHPRRLASHGPRPTPP
jgi:DNA-binding response OmpR family regulator